MTVLFPSSQFAIEKGASRLARHWAPRMQRIDQASQADWMRKSGALRWEAQFAALKQSTMSKPGSFMQLRMGPGIYVSLQTKLSKTWASSLSNFLFTIGLKQSVMKKPLSGMEQTLAFLVFSTRQLLHQNEAIPPAETPVITIDPPSKICHLASKQLNNSLTLRLPRKQSCRSLQLIGFSRQPTYSEPSQQITPIFVQSQNSLFYFYNVESRPLPVVSRVCEAFFVDPRPENERLQQDSRVSESEGSPQKPPPEKYIKKLRLLSPKPSCRQKPGGEPSKHADPCS